MDQLTEKQWQVLDYVKRNPGTTKEGVVRGMDGIYSRIPIINTLKRLENEGLIVCRKNKPNSQSYRLFVNNENTLIFVSQSLDDFKKTFFSLLDATVIKVKKMYRQNTMISKDPWKVIKKTDKIGEVTPLLHEALIIYQQMICTFIFHTILRTPKEIKDSEMLNKLNQVFFSNMVEIQKKISKVFFSIAGTYAVDQELITWRDYFWHVAKTSSNSPLPLLTGTTIKTFKNYELEKELEPVLDSLQKIKF